MMRSAALAALVLLLAAESHASSVAFQTVCSGGR